MQDLAITLIQTELAWENIEANLEMFNEKIDQLTAPGDLIILPEMFSTGFSMNPKGLAEKMTGKTVTWLQHKAAAIQAVITGSVMVQDKGDYFNRLIWAPPKGDIITYDKKHLFRYAGEEKVYTAGRRRVTIEYKGWRIRPFICYDLRFPIWTRRLASSYDLAIFVANWPAKRSAPWRTLLQARAIENQAFVAGVNRVGRDGKGFDYSGHSAVIDPTGKVLFEQENQPCTPTVTLNSQVLLDHREQFPAWMDMDADLIQSTDMDHNFIQK